MLAGVSLIRFWFLVNLRTNLSVGLTMATLAWLTSLAFSWAMSSRELKLKR